MKSFTFIQTRAASYDEGADPVQWMQENQEKGKDAKDLINMSRDNREANMYQKTERCVLLCVDNERLILSLTFSQFYFSSSYSRHVFGNVSGFKIQNTYGILK